MPFGECPWLRQICPHFNGEVCRGSEGERCIHVVAGRAEAWAVTVLAALSGVVPSSPRLRQTIEETLGESAASETRDEVGALSAREVEVLRACLEGGKNREIGERLHISVHTVRNHMKSIYDKLGVRSRTELFSRYSLVRRGVQPRSALPEESERLGKPDEATKQIEL